MAYEITQAIFDNTIEMANDKTAMQDKASTFVDVADGTDLVFDNGTGGSGTSGALTTIDVATGVITIGRVGKLKLSVDGSFESTSGAAEFQLQVHLDTGSGYADTGFGLKRDLAINSSGSFSASFHGTRAVGDKIKLVMVSGTETFVFTSVAVMTEWMT